MNDRSVKLRLSEREVTELCLAAGVGIYSIDCLPLGITRVNCKTDQGANELRMRFRNHVITNTNDEAYHDTSIDDDG